MTDEQQCPVCRSSKAPYVNIHSEKRQVGCPRCGQFSLSPSAMVKLDHLSTYERAIISFALRQRSQPSEMLTTARIDLILSAVKLPAPPEQADNFILWIGTNCLDPGRFMGLDDYLLTAVIGALSPEGVDYIARDLTNQNLLERDRTSTSHSVRLTLADWRHYQELIRGQADSRRAFMVLQFDEVELEDICKAVFEPAVEETGFKLFRLDTSPKAGLIDDRLRADIISSRFLIADLSHENSGAYWESGFAEGRGKPVIYTCQKTKFKKDSTHFDTNHHLTVLWDPDDREQTARDLKATIRATFPVEATAEK